MTRSETLKVLGVLSAAYPNTEISEETAELYIKMLEDVPFTLAQAAVQKHIATKKWFPTIAELRESALSVTGGIPDAASAWAEVLAEVRRIGSYGVPKFSCPEIKKAVDCIGWRNICLSENISIERAHFMRVYEVYEARAKETAKLPPNVRSLIDNISSKSELRLVDGDKNR